MICRIAGQLEAIEQDKAVIDPGHGVVYEVLLPSFTASRLRLSIGQKVTLHTLHLIEATAQGATMYPRLAGFATVQDRQFFELFVTCKGIGHRRALRAMIFDTPTLAAAIADRDLKLVQTMPEVGKKLAETIVVTLRDKVERFVSAAAYPDTGATQGNPTGDATSTAVGTRSGGTLAREALEVLLQLGENRLQAVQWIDRVLTAGGEADTTPPRDVQDVIAAVYRLKAGG